MSNLSKLKSLHKRGQIARPQNPIWIEKSQITAHHVSKKTPRCLCGHSTLKGQVDLIKKVSSLTNKKQNTQLFFDSRVSWKPTTSFNLLLTWLSKCRPQPPSVLFLTAASCDFRFVAINTILKILPPDSSILSSPENHLLSRISHNVLGWTKIRPKNWSTECWRRHRL